MKNIFILTILALFLVGCSAEVQRPIEPAPVAEPKETQPSMMQNPPVMMENPPPMMAQVKAFTITATDWTFTPSEIRVKQGDKVKITIIAQEGDHGIAIPDYGISQKVNEGETITVEFTADKKGSFRFYCNVYCGPGHKEMDGTLIVE